MLIQSFSRWISNFFVFSGTLAEVNKHIHIAMEQLGKNLH